MRPPPPRRPFPELYPFLSRRRPFRVRPAAGDREGGRQGSPRKRPPDGAPRPSATGSPHMPSSALVPRGPRSRSLPGSLWLWGFLKPILGQVSLRPLSVTPPCHLSSLWSSPGTDPQPRARDRNSKVAELRTWTRGPPRPRGTRCGLWFLPGAMQSQVGSIGEVLEDGVRARTEGQARRLQAGTPGQCGAPPRSERLCPLGAGGCESVPPSPDSGSPAPVRFIPLKSFLFLCGPVTVCL